MDKVVMQNTLIPIEIYYASPNKVFNIALDVPLSTTMQEALHMSLNVDAHPEHRDFYQQIPDFSLEKGLFGIFGKIKTLETVLKPGDRIEIYRPLIANPMDARRRRVTKVAKINVKN